MVTSNTKIVLKMRHLLPHSIQQLITFCQISDLPDRLKNRMQKFWLLWKTLLQKRWLYLCGFLGFFSENGAACAKVTY